MYNHQEIEAKWRQIWEAGDQYRVTEDLTKPKFYCLDMFPYPSGVGLHVGHPKGYIASDIFARYKTLQGFNVLHPMGWDAFGLPAENYAIKNKVHPRTSTEANVRTYKEQISSLGLNFDWSREINTTDPSYYRWTQWAFAEMFKRGLVYESHEPINWCPTCLTGLANEDLQDGNCERCDTPIEKKPLRQWVIRITDYAERLLADLDLLDAWDDNAKQMQRNWIGKSEGSTVKFKIQNLKTNHKSQITNSDNDNKEFIEVFTTRPDTIFGATYLVICPEHPLVTSYELRVTNIDEVQAYINQVKNKSDLERTDLNKDKSGVELQGITAINPVTNEELPIYIADYVLSGYGTGAIMAVPAHDERDFEFATKYNLPIKQVVAKLQIQNSKSQDGQVEESTAMTDYGVAINSGFLDGLATAEAKAKMIEWLEEKRVGARKINYKLKDWVFSRQRYWGEPMPLIFCEHCKNQTEFSNKGEELNPGWFVDENLPVTLPDVESYEPSGTGESPLANIDTWVNTTCPHCTGPARRETNTMPQWAGSSWYYLRYMDTANDQALVAPDKFAYWSEVDLYVGGAEHVTRHMIYARFWHKFLQDIGVVTTPEPFINYRSVGLVMGEDGRKMSKRWHNVVNPDEIVVSHGADALRIYEMFIGPFNQSVSWNTQGLSGVRKFLDRVYNLRSKLGAESDNRDLERLMHKTIKKVADDIANFNFNTAVSALMILVNKMSEAENVTKASFENLLLMLSPFAPHLSAELWEQLGYKTAIYHQAWPVYDPSLALDEEIDLVIQVNGKVRDTMKIAMGLGQSEVEALAKTNIKVQKYLTTEPRKIIYIQDKLISFVI